MRPPPRNVFSRNWIILATLVAAAPSPKAYSDFLPENVQVSISFKNDDLPADDLVYVNGGQSEILTPDQALQLKKSGVDLSTLDPSTSSDIWKGVSTEADESLDNALPIQSGDTVTYLGWVCTGQDDGLFKFNVEVQPAGGPATTLSLMISKDQVHATLLRKELLRRLGYKIPAMKYLPQIQLKFGDADTQKEFLADLSGGPVVGCGGTNGSQSRWVLPAAAGPEGGDPLVITMQDLLAMEASPPIENVARGPILEFPPGATQASAEEQRVTRALALPYALTLVPESINEFDWFGAQIESGSVTMEAPYADYACSLDDALWMARRMAALTRDDITQIVAGAYYPEPVAKVLVEKIASRLDSMINVFNLGTPTLAYNSAITEEPSLESGKIIQSNLNQTWPGYASNFAYADAQSPIQGLQWYVLSELETNAMEALTTTAANELPALTEAGDISQHEQDLSQQAISQYLSTGVAQAVPFGVWAAPTASGGVTYERSVVIGSYMGTDNFIQLADNFGLNANVGLYVGVDGLNGSTSLSGDVNGAINVTVTHLKPLTSLKQAITEPIQNTIVPWVFYRASSVLQQAVDSQQPGAAGSPAPSPTDVQNQLKATLANLDNYLAPGDSLILTYSLTGTESLTATVQGPAPFAPGLSITGGANQVVISRIQVYRPEQSPDTIQVFKDNGELAGLSLAFQVTLGTPAQFPVLSVNAQAVEGTAKTQFYTLNISQNSNPDLNSYLSALSSTLRTGSVEVLDSMPKTKTDEAVISTSFQDDTSTFTFFHYVNRTLKTNAKVNIQELWNGASEDYINLSDGSQTGDHYQQLATQAATYLVQRLSGNTAYSVDTQASQNPGQSFLGNSHTRQAQFQAIEDSKGVESPYVDVQYRWEGWQMSAADVEGVIDSLSQKYGFQVYPNGFLGDTTAIQLYEILLNVNLYEPGIAKILSMSVPDEMAMIQRYNVQDGCVESGLDSPNSDDEEAHPLDPSKCDAIVKFQAYMYSYQQGIQGNDKKAQTMLYAVSYLEQFVSFQDLVQLAGGGPDSSNLFVNAVITGFRKGTDVLQNDPQQLSMSLQSNTYGKQPAYNASGVMSSAEGILGIMDGEFYAQWLRTKL